MSDDRFMSVDTALSRVLPPSGSVFAWLADEGEGSREEWVLGPLQNPYDAAVDLAEQASIGEQIDEDGVVVHTLDPSGNEKVWQVTPIFSVTWHARELP